MTAGPGGASMALLLQAAGLETAGPVTEVGLWLSRLTIYLTFTVVVGALLTAASLLPAAAGGVLTPTGRRAVRVGAWAAVAWAVASVALLLFGLSNAAARPLQDVVRPELLSPFVGSRFGAVVVLSAVVALLVAALAAVARTRPGAQVALAGAALGALGPALWGHAGGAGAFAVASDALHVLGAAAWVGGLVALVAVVLRSDVEPFAPTERYSGIAALSLVVVGLSGVASTSVHLDELGQLLDTSWGRLVLVKLALFVVVAALGWGNRTRRLPALAAGGGEARRAFRRLAAAEVVVMVAAMAAAATMTSGIPADVEAATRVRTVQTAFGDGVVDVTVDPSGVGTNAVHVYFFDAQGQPASVSERSLTLSMGDTVVDVPLFVAGPGHDTSPAVEIPEPGTYTVTIQGTVDGERVEASGSITVT